MFPSEVSFKTKNLYKIAVSPPGAFVVGVAVTSIARAWPSEGAAAWVQAIGSIAAIVGAFMVAQRTHQMERKSKSEDSIRVEVEALCFAENAAYEAYSAVHQIAEYALPRPSFISLSRLEEVRHTLRCLLNKPLPAEAFSSVFVVQEQVSEALSAAVRVTENYGDSSYEIYKDSDELKRRRDNLMDARRVIAGLYWNKARIAGIPFSRRPEDETAANDVQGKSQE
ncbi:hypothetical protein [Pseudomonas canadensis]|uniref:hypothetical protein n=1 Tax=Pseudomonas canadensis TaxID=915099 RepID=UPI0028112FEF|nr:hypothetical protein [Pseudomonas canadensis]